MEKTICRKNKGICVLLGLILIVLFCGCSNTDPGAKEKQSTTPAVKDYKDYNVIIIAFDGMQSKHLYSYGYPLDTTPALDKLLDKSYLFTKAVSPASWTVPTYMSVFTSMYPSEHKLTNKFSGFDAMSMQYIKSNLKQLAPDAVTLAEIFKQNGYKTAAFTGDAGISGAFGYSQGFDEYYDATMFGGLDTSVPKAVDWLEKNKDQKFFLFLHGYDVHGQYAPAGGFDYRYVKTRYSGNYTGSPKEQGAIREQGLAGSLNLSDEDLRFWRAVYDEKINRADGQFKLFMDRAEGMGLMDNTIFVVFSDHGTEFYEHEKFDHGHTLYGELVDILFSIRLPGQEQGKRVDSLVSTLDIMPTVLKLIGVENPVPKQTKGIDLTPSFTGTDVSRSVFSETDYRLYTHKRSIQMPEGWKLIVTYPGKEKELYNLRSDPAEKANLADIETAKADELGKLIDEHLNRMNATGPWTLGCVPVYNDQCKDPASSPASQQTLAGKKNLNSNKPNILLINIDSFRADHMGIYGYQRNITPFMDSFFRKGVIFDTAIATGPYTFHTDASIFTSLYPSQNGVYTWRTPQRKDAISLTKILKDKGYRTGAFVSQGLFMESFTLAYFDIYSKNNDVKNLNASSQKARDWIALNDTPYFAFWHLYDVHLPYMPPTKDFYARPYNGFFSNKSIYISWPRQTSKTIEHTNENGTNSSQYVITPADIEYLRESYDYGILATDKGLESFFQSLKKSGYLNNTIVIISSEHGEDLKEHGYFFHSDVYENNMHVPLVIYYPGITPRRITEPVSSLDIMPTVLGLINETIPPGLEGVDLFAPGALNMSRAVYSERPPNGEFAVRTDRWKYILRNPDLKSKESLNFIKKIDKENKFFYLIALNDENTGDELYDLSADPNEQNNLIGKGFPAEEELKAKVTEFRDRMNAAKEKNQIGEHLNEVPIFSYP